MIFPHVGVSRGAGCHVLGPEIARLAHADPLALCLQLASRDVQNLLFKS
jgi:hypothetical protein